MKRTLFGCCVALAGVAGLGALARRGTKKKNIAAAQREEIKAPAGRPQTINWTMNYGGARLVVPPEREGRMGPVRLVHVKKKGKENDRP